MKSIKSMADAAANRIKDIEEWCDGDAAVLDMDRSLQLDKYSCGAQSAYAILNYYGRARSIESVKNQLGTAEDDGTSQTSMIKLFRKKGLSVSVRPSATLKDIHYAIDDLEAPMLVYMKDNDHWSVVYGYSSDRIYVLDPSLKSAMFCGWSKNEFKDRWSRWGAIVYEK